MSASRTGRSVNALAVVAIVAAAIGASGCAIVPQNRRKHLGDPMMSVDGDVLLTAGQRKLYTSRESAAGGDAAPAGGGCGCQ